MVEAWGEAPGTLFVNDAARARARDRAGGQRRPADPAAARLRREPDRDLPRPRPRADAPLPRRLPLAGARLRGGRRRPPRQARLARVAARQERRAVRELRHRRGARQPAAGLPVPRQRPRRGRAGQAPRARDDRRPPRAADGARGVVRRHRPPRAAARRARQHRGDGPGQAAGDPRRDLDADAGRPAAPRPRARRAPGRRGVRRLHPARRRLAVRDQGRPDPRRAARPRRGAERRGPGQPGAGDPARRAGVRRAGAAPCPGCARRSGLDDARPRRGDRAVDAIEARPRGPRRADGEGRLGRRAAPPSCTTTPRCSGCWRSPRPRSCRGWPRTTDELDAVAARPRRRLHPRRSVRLAAARPGQRAADRPQLLHRRPAGGARRGWPGRPGQAMADSLVERYLDDTGGYPASVGLSVWGTSRDAHLRRRHRRGARAARRTPRVGRGVAPGHRPRR